MENRISIIAAKTENNVIGYANDMPWHLPNDLKHFKDITYGHTVIMGRGTFESMKSKALPGRNNIVISRNPGNLLKKKDITTTSSLEELLYEAPPEEEVFIIGGGQLFDTCMMFADKIYLTEIHVILDTEDNSPDYVFFPKISKHDWKEISREDHKSDERHEYPYSFVELVRK